MSSPFDNEIAAMMAGFTQQRDVLIAVRQVLETATVAVSSVDSLVSVTMSLTGEIKDVAFAQAGYAQLSAAELSAVVMETIVKARREAAIQAEARTREVAGPSATGAGLGGTMVGGDELGDLLAGLDGLWAPRYES